MWQFNRLQYISSGKIHNVLFTEEWCNWILYTIIYASDVLFWNYPKRRNRYDTVKENQVSHLTLSANVGRCFKGLHQQSNTNILLTAAVWTSGNPSLEEGCKVIHEWMDKFCHRPSKCRMHKESVAAGNGCSTRDVLCVLSHFCLPSSTTAWAKCIWW